MIDLPPVEPHGSSTVSKEKLFIRKLRFHHPKPWVLSLRRNGTPVFSSVYYIDCAAQAAALIQWRRGA